MRIFKLAVLAVLVLSLATKVAADPLLVLPATSPLLVDANNVRLTFTPLGGNLGRINIDGVFFGTTQYDITTDGITSDPGLGLFDLDVDFNTSTLQVVSGSFVAQGTHPIFFPVGLYPNLFSGTPTAFGFDSSTGNFNFLLTQTAASDLPGVGVGTPVALLFDPAATPPGGLPPLATFFDSAFSIEGKADLYVTPTPTAFLSGFLLMSGLFVSRRRRATVDRA